MREEQAIRLLSDPEFARRQEAFWSLQRAPEIDDVEGILDVAAQDTRDLDAPPSLALLLLGLRCVERPGVLEFFERLTNHSRDDVRFHAACVLLETGHSDLVPGALEDEIRDYAVARNVEPQIVGATRYQMACEECGAAFNNYCDDSGTQRFLVCAVCQELYFYEVASLEQRPAERVLLGYATCLCGGPLTPHREGTCPACSSDQVRYTGSGGSGGDFTLFRMRQYPGV